MSRILFFLIDAGTFAELAVRLVSSKKRSLMFNLSNCPDREILKTGGSDTFFLLLEGKTRL